MTTREFKYFMRSAKIGSFGAIGSNDFYALKKRAMKLASKMRVGIRIHIWKFDEIPKKTGYAVKYKTGTVIWKKI